MRHDSVGSSGLFFFTFPDRLLAVLLDPWSLWFVTAHAIRRAQKITKDALDRFLEASNPLVSLMLDEVARILRAYKELRDSRLNDVLEVGRGFCLLLPFEERRFDLPSLWCTKKKTFSILRVFLFRKASSMAQISTVACFTKPASCVYHLCLGIRNQHLFVVACLDCRGWTRAGTVLSVLRGGLGATLCLLRLESVSYSTRRVPEQAILKII